MLCVLVLFLLLVLHLEQHLSFSLSLFFNPLLSYPIHPTKPHKVRLVAPNISMHSFCTQLEDEEERQQPHPSAEDGDVKSGELKVVGGRRSSCIKSAYIVMHNKRKMQTTFHSCRIHILGSPNTISNSVLLPDSCMPFELNRSPTSTIHRQQWDRKWVCNRMLHFAAKSITDSNDHSQSDRESVENTNKLSLFCHTVNKKR